MPYCFNRDLSRLQWPFAATAWAAVIGLLLGACGSLQPLPTATRQPPPTASPTQTNSPTRTPMSASATPTATPSSSNTATPIGTATLTPQEIDRRLTELIQHNAG